MRYDGMARRSQKQEKTAIDRVWSFFSSVKVAVYLIIITLTGASLGTIFPQEDTFLGNLDPSVYYEQTYGTAGKIYYLLGLSHTYTSWWFLTLLLMIGTSLVVCSLDRVLPLYRALSKQQVRKHQDFLQRQKVVYSGEVPDGDGEALLDKLEQSLKRRRYRVYRGESALLAEKNRFSRWGPYINHIGLIIFLLTLVFRSFPGMTMDEYISILEGETKQIPGTNLYLKNERFTLEVYGEDELRGSFKEDKAIIPKLFQTDAVLYECTANCSSPNGEPELKEVLRHAIVLNDPLHYKGISAYQFDYDITPTLTKVNLYLTPKTEGSESYGPIELQTKNPKLEYTAGPYKLTLKDYFPEFALNEQGVPITKSRDPKAPAFIFVIQGPGLAAQGESFIYFPREVDKVMYQQDKLNASIAAKLELKARGMEDVEIATYTTSLNLRKDTVVPFLFIGGIIFMIGVVMGLYWQHRRIWVRIDERNVLLGAHTNKNWYGLRHDTAKALSAGGITVEPKELERFKEEGVKP